MKSTTDKNPIRFIIDERLDFNHFVPLRKSYVVASSYRSGSQYLCWRLWQTGLLGAPSEVLNPTSEMRVLMNRFKASSGSDYIGKLIAHRTSRNGVFGMKAHFHHFEAFLNAHPDLIETLSPISYIYISREDKVAQAVSMAKALQTDAWTSRMEEGPKPVLVYDRAMIAHCLVDIEKQDLTWRRWFETHNVTPFRVTYDQLTADAEGVVKSFVEFMGVQDDEPEQVDVPPARKQGDETNTEWIERFERDAKSGAHSAPDPGSAGSDPSPDAHFFERYGDMVRSIPTGGASATGFLDLVRLRRRYDAIVARNRDLFQEAHVLDMTSGDGFWSLAALDAGAAHVVGVEASCQQIAAARQTFVDQGIDEQSHRFINSEPTEAMQDFEPGEFDLVLCQGSFERTDFFAFFEQLQRLRPRHAILDTEVVVGEGPIFRFTLGVSDIIGSPNHALIMFLCNAFDFQWRLVDWRTLGLTDWTAIKDYERDHRRTYILERMPE